MTSPKRYIWLLFLPVVFLVSCTNNQVNNSDEVVATQPLDGLDQYIETAVQTWGAPGLAIAIVKNDEVVYAKGFGVREMGKPESVDSETLFHIGSTTKAFITMALGMLVSDGEIKWNDKVISHMPDFRVADPSVTQDLTVIDIVTHRSGVQTGDLLWVAGLSREQIIANMANAPQVFSFRSDFQYNNNMYLLAGELIEAVSGMPFEDFIRSRILDPLGMKATTLYMDEWTANDNRTAAHDTLNDQPMRPIEYPSIYNAGGAGLMNSNVSEMTQWIRFLLNKGTLNGEQLVSSRSFDAIFEPYIFMQQSPYPAASQAESNVFGYGLGWFLQDYRGQKMIMHTGSIWGQSAILGLLPEENLGVVVYINADHIELRHALMYHVFDRYLGETDKDWSTDLFDLYTGINQKNIQAQKEAEAQRQSDTKPTHSVSDYAGTYNHPYFDTIQILSDGSNLSFEYGVGLHGTMGHWQHDQFQVSFHDERLGKTVVEFKLNEQNEVVAVQVFGESFNREY